MAVSDNLWKSRINCILLFFCKSEVVASRLRLAAKQSWIIGAALPVALRARSNSGMRGAGMQARGGLGHTNRSKRGHTRCSEHLHGAGLLFAFHAPPKVDAALHSAAGNGLARLRTPSAGNRKPNRNAARGIGVGRTMREARGTWQPSSRGNISDTHAKTVEDQSLYFTRCWTRVARRGRAAAIQVEADISRARELSAM